MNESDAAVIAAVRRMLLNGEARSLRISRRLSLAELGAAIGKSGTEVARYEKGDVLPRPATALRMGSLFAELIEVGE